MFEQTVTEPAHIHGGVLDLMLIDVPDVVEVWVGSPVRVSFLQIIVQFYRCYAGATKTSLGMYAGLS